MDRAELTSFFENEGLSEDTAKALAFTMNTGLEVITGPDLRRLLVAEFGWTPRHAGAVVGWLVRHNCLLSRDVVPRLIYPTRTLEHLRRPT